MFPMTLFREVVSSGLSSCTSNICLVGWSGAVRTGSVRAWKSLMCLLRFDLRVNLAVHAMPLLSSPRHGMYDLEAIAVGTVVAHMDTGFLRWRHCYYTLRFPLRRRSLLLWFGLVNRERW